MFSRLAIFVNLDKPLVPQIVVEYEAQPSVCFACGKYEHTKELCSTMMEVKPHSNFKSVLELGCRDAVDATAVGDSEKTKQPEFKLWMLVERRPRRNTRAPPAKTAAKSRVFSLGSRFSALSKDGNFTSDDGLEKESLHDKDMRVKYLKILGGDFFGIFPKIIKEFCWWLIIKVGQKEA